MSRSPSNEVMQASQRLAAAFERLERLLERQQHMEQNLRKARKMVDNSIEQVEMLLEEAS